MTDRTIYLTESKEKIHAAIDRKMRSLTVVEACYLAEQWVLANVPQDRQKWIRRRVPVMTRARYAVANKIQWGSFYCSGWPI